MEHEVLEQPADVVVDERGDDRGAQAEAAAQAARDVVLAAALPDAKRAGRAHASFAWIKAQHDLAERDEVVAARLGGPDRRARSWPGLRGDENGLLGEARHGREIAVRRSSAGATIQLPPTAATEGRRR